MKRSHIAILLALMFVLVYGAPALADPPIPSKPAGLVTDLGSAPLQVAERARLEKALGAYSPEKWKVLIVDTAADPGAYLDQVWAKWSPEAETILLVVYAKQNTAQLQLGASFATWQIKFDQVYPYVKSEYNPAVKDGRMTDGILALAAKVHGLVAATGVKASAPSPDKSAATAGGTAPGGSQTPAPKPAATGTNDDSPMSSLGDGIRWMLVGGAVALALGLLPMIIRRLRRR